VVPGAAGPMVTPGNADPTCPNASEAEHVSKAQPNSGDHMNCTRLALIVIGVTGHPGTSGIVG